AGLRTVITRSTDIFVPLSVRSAIADAERDAIFVSIHYNASPRSSAHGIETYSENNRGAVLAARIQQEIIDRVSTENRGIRSAATDRKSTRLNSSHVATSYAVFCLKKHTAERDERAALPPRATA